MELPWITKMFLVSTAGSLSALFWPVAIAVWKIEMSKYHASLRPNRAHGGMGAGRRKRTPTLIRWLELLLKLLVLPFLRLGMKWLRFILLALFIAVVAAAVGFAGFLQDPATRASLEQLDALAYFSAFNYGFTASSLVEEGLKPPASNRTDD